MTRQNRLSVRLFQVPRIFGIAIPGNGRYTTVRSGGDCPPDTNDGRDCCFASCLSWTTALHFLCLAAPRERQALSQTEDGPPYPFWGRRGCRPYSTRSPRGSGRKTMSKNIYVGNLPFTTTSDDLRDWFAEHGNVTR